MSVNQFSSREKLIWVTDFDLTVFSLPAGRVSEYFTGFLAATKALTFEHKDFFIPSFAHLQCSIIDSSLTGSYKFYSTVKNHLSEEEATTSLWNKNTSKGNVASPDRPMVEQMYLINSLFSSSSVVNSQTRCRKTEQNRNNNVTFRNSSK